VLEQQHLLPDISSVCSLYRTYCIVNNNSANGWYNCWLCFRSYFKNLSKL